MDVEFDPDKDAANLLKHKISLARASDFEMKSLERDPRLLEEIRFRSFGLLDDLPHSFAFTVRGMTIRAISLRRAHVKEYRRHVR